MSKKLFPFVLLAAAILLFVWIKTHQNGTAQKERIIIEAASQADAGSLPRTGTKLIYSRHAKCRMACRQISNAEVEDILLNGTINYSKIQESDKGKTYPLEGLTKDNQNVRIVFAPHGSETVVVTVIDLDKEWPCDCK